ncbi:LptE family protein [Chitinispirillales bacterium ANBcel5]|uniref:LPS assembly lipoprotein LptE n=1 Tax=Cellulosispirillum alkaliphilum TaxID=3039283 RepID=UPI002A4EC24B|nr:LptE family protein [Chitinispirillales bacterium ANBcel5]
MKHRAVLNFLFLIAALVLIGCGVYTFSGSSLPNHLKTVELPLFANNSLEPGVAEDLTQELNREIVSGNLLRVVNDNGDAVIRGTVVAYSNDPYAYGTVSDREVDIDQYIVNISADVSFFDNKRSQAIYEGTVRGEGIYDFKNETEDHGKQRAINDLVERILQRSVQSW